jgi:glutaredoxin-related protein
MKYSISQLKEWLRRWHLNYCGGDVKDSTKALKQFEELLDVPKDGKAKKTKEKKSDGTAVGDSN